MATSPWPRSPTTLRAARYARPTGTIVTVTIAAATASAVRRSFGSVPLAISSVPQTTAM